jgi:O-antigen ligase
VAVLCGLAAFLVVTLWKGPDAYSGFAHRLAVWRIALDHLTPMGWLIGAGPGSWGTTVPLLQLQQQIYPSEVFLQGHNEWLQLLFESGAVAVACLGGWLWAHKRAWTGPYGPSLWAILICSLGMFGFRLAMTGCVALVILGLATSEATNPEEQSV